SGVRVGRDSRRIRSAPHDLGVPPNQGRDAVSCGLPDRGNERSAGGTVAAGQDGGAAAAGEFQRQARAAARRFRIRSRPRDREGGARRRARRYLFVRAVAIRRSGIPAAEGRDEVKNLLATFALAFAFAAPDAEAHDAPKIDYSKARETPF